MFRHRRSSQKPNDDFYESFKASFPHLASSSRPPEDEAEEEDDEGGGVAITPVSRSLSLTDAVMPDLERHSRGPFGNTNDFKDPDPASLRDSHDHWSRFTPSIMDPNSYAFASFANQPPGYYTPTPGGINTLHHSQRAGDLHTPNFGIGLGTPLSLPTSEAGLHAGQTSSATMHTIHPQSVAPHMFNNSNPFAMQHHHSDYSGNHSYSNPQAAFDSMDRHHVTSPQDDMEMHSASPTLDFATQHFGTGIGHTPLQKSLEQFRYHTTLHAKTAMTKPGEIPVTYINKGYLHTLSVVDTASHRMPMAHQTYRTFVRISFDDEKLRQRPSDCWQLWRDGRGGDEAHHREGRLQALEYVDPSQLGGSDSTGRANIEIEHASFDGFSVIWSPNSDSSTQPELSLTVRFNFLSTDFTLAKGVKGIAVRLCAKTELLDSGMGGPRQATTDTEVCYCKVKLFRDHGSERKLHNDEQQIDKAISKVKQQITQFESGSKDSGKKKRSAQDGGLADSNRPHKVPKHKRAWSSTSSTSSTSHRVSVEFELREKLAKLENMYTSRLPASVLYLRGDPEDDPDLYPVHLPALKLSVKTDQEEHALEGNESAAEPSSAMVSAAPSIVAGSGTTTFKHPSPFAPPARVPSNEWSNVSSSAADDAKPAAFPSTAQFAETPTKIRRSHSIALSDHSDWIEATGVDSSYRPPPERIVKPVACFYVLLTNAGNTGERKYYRAIYLMRRSLKDLVNNIALKAGVEPTRVLRTLRVNRKGLEIVIDDELVVEIPEGQDMKAELVEVSSSKPMKRDVDVGSFEVQVDGEIPTTQLQATGYELRLRF